MRVGIIGAGGIAQLHGPAIRAVPGNEVVAVADSDPVRAKVLAEGVGGAPCYTDVRRMLDEAKPEAVHVLTPPQTHAEIAILAMEHGCHVLVEKPLALSTPDAERMVSTALRKSVCLCVDHNILWERTFRRALDLAAAEAIGKVLSVTVDMAFDPRRVPAYLDEGTEKSHWLYRLPGGPLQDQMPHPAYLVMQFLDGIEDVKTFSRWNGLLPKGWDDEIEVAVRSRGVFGRIRISFNERPDALSVLIRGTRGRIHADLFAGVLRAETPSPLPRAAERALLPFRAGFRHTLSGWVNAFRFASGKADMSNGLAPLVKRFYQALPDPAALPVPMGKALLSVELMDRIWPPKAARGEPAQAAAAAAPAVPVSGPLNLVTGGTGFLGYYLVKRLVADQARVRVLVRRGSAHAGRLADLGVETVFGDLSEAPDVRAAMSGVDTVFHAGGAMSNNWTEHEEVTFKGTKHVVEAALEQKVRRLVHVSSMAVYELLNLKPGALVDETCPMQSEPRRMGPYAFAKVRAERIVTEAARNQGLAATIIRPGIILGEYGRIFYPQLGYKLKTDVFIPIGRGHNILPLVYVSNCVDGIVRAARSENSPGKIYNLVDEGKISVNEFLDTYKRITGSRARIVHMPYWMAWLLTLVYEGVSGLGLIKKGATSRVQLKWKQMDVCYDSARARADLGWTSQVPLRDGLDRTFRWYADRYGV